MSHLAEMSQELRRYTWLHVIVYLEFLIAATIVIFTVVGTAFAQPVLPLLLMALLQFLIAVPGCAYNTQPTILLLWAYIALQAVTGISEAIWLVVLSLKDDVQISGDVALAILVLVQLTSVVVALFFRNSTLNLSIGKQETMDTHLRHVPHNKTNTIFPKAIFASMTPTSFRTKESTNSFSSLKDSTASSEELHTASKTELVVPRYERKLARDLETGPDKSIRHEPHKAPELHNERLMSKNLEVGPEQSVRRGVKESKEAEANCKPAQPLQQQQSSAEAASKNPAAGTVDESSRTVQQMRKRLDALDKKV